MRVDFTTFGVEPPENSKTNRGGQTDAAGTGSKSAPGVDQTRFSFDQTRVRSLEAQALAQPEVRAAKVQSLRQAIGKGEYSVPASHVADALVADWAAQG